MPGTDVTLPRTIVVVGEGTASGSPDQCIVAAALNVTRDTVGEAISDVAALADAAVAALHEAGVDQSDIATLNLGVNDYFDHQRQQVTARVATYSFSVTAHALHDVSRLVNVLTATAGDVLQIQGIGFSHSDPEPLLAAARRDAVADARSRAGQLALAAGLSLGDVLMIDEGSGAGSGTFGRAISAGGPYSAMSMPTFPMNPGEHAVSVRVVATYAIST